MIIRSTMVDHGRPWSTMVDHGRAWDAGSTTVIPGRAKKTTISQKYLRCKAPPTPEFNVEEIESVAARATADSITNNCINIELRVRGV